MSDSGQAGMSARLLARVEDGDSAEQLTTNANLGVRTSLKRPEDMGPLEEAGGPEKEQNGGTRGAVRALCEDPRFQIGVSLVIMGNAIVIGMETDHKYPELCEKLEKGFMAIFVSELLMRLYAFGGAFLTNEDRGWNLFDFTIVSLGVFDEVTEAMAGPGKHKKNSIMTLLRMFRLLRMLRVFRLFRMFKQLYLLATGFGEALMAVVWVSLMLFLLLFVCAIVLTHICADQYQDKDQLDDPNVKFGIEKFGTIAQSMFTLFEIMAYPNLENVEPMFSMGGGMVVFFIAFIILGSWSMLSLLTGVMSEHMIEKSAARKEEMKSEAQVKRRVFLKNLNRIFSLADEDNSGGLSRAEFLNAVPTVANLMSQEGLNVGVKDLEAVFDTIDFDSSGTIDVEEFIFGMSQLSEDLGAKHVMDLQYAMLRAEKTLNVQVSDLEQHLSYGLQDIHKALSAAKERRRKRDSSMR
jgi:hypothetical protein